MAELRRRGGGGKTESGAILLGKRRQGDRRLFERCVYYGDLDANAYSTGVCVLYADAFEKLWGICRSTGRRCSQTSAPMAAVRPRAGEPAQSDDRAARSPSPHRRTLRQQSGVASPHGTLPVRGFARPGPI